MLKSNRTTSPNNPDASAILRRIDDLREAVVYSALAERDEDLTHLEGECGKLYEEVESDHLEHFRALAGRDPVIGREYALARCAMNRINPLRVLEIVEGKIVGFRACREMGLASPSHEDCERLWRQLEEAVLAANGSLPVQRVAAASAQIAEWQAVLPEDPQLSFENYYPQNRLPCTKVAVNG